MSHKAGVTVLRIQRFRGPMDFFCIERVARGVRLSVSDARSNLTMYLISARPAGQRL